MRKEEATMPNCHPKLDARSLTLLQERGVRYIAFIATNCQVNARALDGSTPFYWAVDDETAQDVAALANKLVKAGTHVVTPLSVGWILWNRQAYSSQ
jgi:hypothetical protein